MSGVSRRPENPLMAIYTAWGRQSPAGFSSKDKGNPVVQRELRRTKKALQDSFPEPGPSDRRIHY